MPFGMPVGIPGVSYSILWQRWHTIVLNGSYQGMDGDFTVMPKP
jgi:hypothetical protein